MDWLDDLATELGQDPLSAAEVTALLDLARDVAHGTERRFAPLSALLIGRALGADDEGRGERLDALIARTRSRIPGPTST